MYENSLKDLTRDDTFDVVVLLEYLQEHGVIEIRDIDKLPRTLDDWNEEE